MASRKVMIAAIEASRTSARTSAMGKSKPIEEQEVISYNRKEAHIDERMKKWKLDGGKNSSKKGRGILNSMFGSGKRISGFTLIPIVMMIVMLIVFANM